MSYWDVEGPVLAALEVGQVWEQQQGRRAGRRCRVVEVIGTSSTCDSWWVTLAPVSGKRRQRTTTIEGRFFAREWSQV